MRLQDLAKIIILLHICDTITWVTATCSLDQMRMFAMEACEHLMKFEDTSYIRERRHISHTSNKILKNKLIGDNYHKVVRDIYPVGGFLKVPSHYYYKFKMMKIFPKYKGTTKSLSHHRYKRAAADNNIFYCCYNTCDENFFCY